MTKLPSKVNDLLLNWLISDIIPLSNKGVHKLKLSAVTNNALSLVVVYLTRDIHDQIDGIALVNRFLGYLSGTFENKELDQLSLLIKEIRIESWQIEIVCGCEGDMEKVHETLSKLPRMYVPGSSTDLLIWHDPMKTNMNPPHITLLVEQ